MLTPWQETLIQFGSTEVATFNSACQPGDWNTWKIGFTPPFPKKPCVIVTAHDRNTDPDSTKCPVVGVARNVDENGFTLAARNPQPSGGEAALYWLALIDTPDERQPRNEILRMGTMDPKHLGTSDWVSWSVRLSQPKLPEIPAVFLTASNLFAEAGSFVDKVGQFSFTMPTNHNAAAAGIVREQTKWGFHLAAYNTDCAEGYSNFRYLALAKVPPGITGAPPGDSSDVWVDSGYVAPASFAPECQEGDWKSWYVWFDQAFLTPPIVLVTAMNVTVQPQAGNPAVVGIAQYVTPNGFRLAARNSDCAGGLTGFYWVAIGCQRGCG